MRENESTQRHYLYTHFTEAILYLRPFMKSPARFSAVFVFLLFGAFVCTRLINFPTLIDTSQGAVVTTGASQKHPPETPNISKSPPPKLEIPLNCTAYNLTRTCPSNYPTTFSPEQDPDSPSPPPTCPEYFRWIYEDLRPWALTGITKEMVQSAKRTANFKLVILNGKAYLETYQKSFQTRDVFTLWGILQLLRRYPGKVPDLELMFDCVDWPVILSRFYSQPNSTAPPPLFRYCGDGRSLDIVFPDWSFWGWSEINIKPWELLLKDLEEGNNRSKWIDREPYAYWKGNPFVAETRKDLLKCNVSEQTDWNARVYAQDWFKESREGYKQSDLASQCVHRYKIYIEGSAWSVSEKYILACDSVTLIVKPRYYDFFTRGLIPVHHYWPIKDDDKCRSIKFAVDWGNSHKKKAQSIGKEASKMIQEDLKMDYVYDYMFHLLSEYSKLLQFKPTIPRKAVELCSEAMVCQAQGLEKKFMMDSMVKGPAERNPCAMPPPFDPASLFALLRRQANSIKQTRALSLSCGHFMESPARLSAIFVFLFVLVGALVCTRLLNSSTETLISTTSSQVPILTTKTSQTYPNKTGQIPQNPSSQFEIPLNCTAYNLTTTCPSNYPTTFHPEQDPDRPSSPTCPEYFRWIHEDLRPWAHTGITRDMVERANRTANFKLVIVNGKAYVEQYEKAFQTRDTFTIWGILQLLRKYPGKVPDLEMMFDCVDWPVILSGDYDGPNSTTPPPLFRYCGDDSTLDIVFPDWSFWGWAEINIRPWETLLKNLEEGNKRSKWLDREPYAYWKGNPTIAEHRQELMTCNVSDQYDWYARLYAQDWSREAQEGFKRSDLASQCVHRYKIYIEGSAWSVSEKYILACDSVTLIVKPRYYDFFTRTLMPLHHYWPIKYDDKCRSIKFAVDWGNSHKKKAQAIGRASSKLIQEDLKMDYVYDYMFHLLNEYANLLQFKPRIPQKAIELCSEAMACQAEGLENKFMMESLVKGPAVSEPCSLPPPYDPASLFEVLRRKESSIKQVETWEKNYWKDHEQS
ncbi:hypothetical protein FF1_001982 [Malus domestica]